MTKPLILSFAAALLLALSACRAESHDDEALPLSAIASTGDWRAFEPLSEAELREGLSPLAFRVTQEDATERPFTSALDGNERDGLYVDIVSGEPLFSSRDKFDSGTGWPSFTQPIHAEALTSRLDYELIYSRSEVRSAIADSHLGHVFPDGPAPTGLRYCINGAALHFVAAAELESRGYGEFTPLFEE